MIYYLGGIPLRQAEPLAYGDKAPTVTFKPELENVWTKIARAEREKRGLGTPIVPEKVLGKRGPKGKSHCKHGHERTPENLYYTPSNPVYGKCRQCIKMVYVNLQARRARRYHLNKTKLKQEKAA